MIADIIYPNVAQAERISSIETVAAVPLGIEQYSARIEKCFRYLSSARAISRLANVNANSKNELMYLQLLRAAQCLGQGLVACNALDARFLPSAISPGNRLLHIFDRIHSVNPNFFPLPCETSLPSAEWAIMNQTPVRSALDRQGILDMASKAEWLLWGQIPPGGNPFKLPKFTAEEWVMRFEMLLDTHVITLPQRLAYMVNRQSTGSVGIQALV